MRMKNKRVSIQIGILSVLLGICTGIYFFCHYIENTIGLLFSSLAFIVGGWLLLSATYRIVKKTRWLALLFLFIFCFGVFVYQGVNEQRYVLDPINNTLSIFFPSRGEYSRECYGGDLYYQLLHSVSYLFFAMIAFSFFGRRLLNRNGYYCIIRRHKNVFWDHSTGGMILAQDMLNRDLWQQAVFVLPNSIKDNEELDKALFEQIDSMGAIALYRDFDQMERFPSAHRHFFLTEDQDFNVRMALKVARSAKTKTHLYIRTEMKLVELLFTNLPNIELYIFNQSDLTARKFIIDNHMLDVVPNVQIENLLVRYDFRILILGFGWTGREVMNKCICDSQFLGATFSATIFDENFLDENGSYPMLYDECIKAYQLDFMTNRSIRKVGSRGFYQWFEINIGSYDRVIICMGDDRKNLDTAVTIFRVYEKLKQEYRKKIFVHVKEHGNYCYCNYPITLFGDLTDIYSYDTLINEKMDTIAKLVNYVYCNTEVDIITDLKDKMSEAESKWDLSNNFFDKDSSRAVALNIDNIIRICKGPDSFKKAIDKDSTLKILAENEHLRWVAFHLTRGIGKWDEIPDNHPTDAKLYRNNDGNDQLLKHACLVPYNELDKISKRVNKVRWLIGKKDDKDYQATDRRIVRHFLLLSDL